MAKKATVRVGSGQKSLLSFFNVKKLGNPPSSTQASTPKKVPHYLIRGSREDTKDKEEQETKTVIEKSKRKNVDAMDTIPVKDKSNKKNAVVKTNTTPLTKRKKEHEMTDEDQTGDNVIGKRLGIVSPNVSKTIPLKKKSKLSKKDVIVSSTCNTEKKQSKKLNQPKGTNLKKSIYRRVIIDDSDDEVEMEEVQEDVYDTALVDSDSTIVNKMDCEDSPYEDNGEDYEDQDSVEKCDDEDNDDASFINDEEEDEEELSLESLESSDDDSIRRPPTKKVKKKSAETNECNKRKEEKEHTRIQNTKMTSVATQGGGGWGFLSYKSPPKTKKRVVRTTGSASGAKKSNTGIGSIYTAGDDLPILSHPQAMFDDMITSNLTKNGTDTKKLAPLYDALANRPLRVATMCSGTESPVLALDMICKSLEDFHFQHMKKVDKKDLNESKGNKSNRGKGRVQIEHIFSCEIEPFKQAYIERNFQPPLLFRDIRELGKDSACTAYGSLADVPNQPGCVDLLIAGTSCVDYSNLNNEKKTIEGDGESGQTFRGMLDWIKKSKTPLVLLENVMGAPWSVKVELFEKMGYHAEFVYVDTKKYYIPHTRMRGYLFAIRKDASVDGKKIPSGIVREWKEMVKGLERPASSSLDAFMLPNDDPRVLRGRARLSASSNGNSIERNSRVDWTRCETRHLYARSEEELGDKRPLTGWSESGNTSLPDFAWNEWANSQVHRIHDLMDINALRLAKEGVDATYKTMVWNLSQNVDRDTMGKLGLSQCLTPSCVPYVTNRGGPLVGEELLLLQGIPADDLLLTRMSDDNMKDLAGNAMSTTVVGACMLSALCLGHNTLVKDSDDVKNGVGEVIRCLVPRPLGPASKDVQITQTMGRYVRKPLMLGPIDPPTSTESESTFSRLLKHAALSARKCTLEGVDKVIPFKDLLRCRLCGHTASVDCITPVRKYEEHDYEPCDHNISRVKTSIFRKELLDLLPMRISMLEFDADILSEPKGIKEKLWVGWTQAFKRVTTMPETGEPAEFRFTRIVRSHIWTAQYTSANESRLELRLSDTTVQWFLFAKPPPEQGQLRKSLQMPIARMQLEVTGSTDGSKTPFSLLSGEWEICLPVETPIDVIIEGKGGRVDSWNAKLGLKGSFEKESRYEKLNIKLKTEGQTKLKKMVEGTYQLLPKCGAACGSLHKRIDPESSTGGDIYFFLESERRTLPEDDTYIFSHSKHRTDYEEYRDAILRINPKLKYRPSAPKDPEDVSEKKETLSAFLPGKWVAMPSAMMTSVADKIGDSLESLSSSNFTVPSSQTKLSVPISYIGWKQNPEILRCNIPIDKNDKLYQQCKIAMSLTFDDDISAWMDVNLRKSKAVFDALAFVTSRVSVPNSVSDSWLSLVNNPGIRKNGEDVPCSKCAPQKPGVKWMVVTKGKRKQYVPKEDGKEAAVYEQKMKTRPHPWVVRVRTLDADNVYALQLSVGLNPVSLTQRSMGLFLHQSLARKALKSGDLDTSNSECVFDWRIAPHVDKSFSSEQFGKMYLTSNKKDKYADQPKNFKKYGLRPEQLRSLSWMLAQEATLDPFMEEEVTEAILPSLNWRGEGRVRRPVLVRGGVVADEVGYGKTAISLGLIDAAPNVNGPPPSPPEDFKQSHIFSAATLIIVPSHLMGQWPKETAKFLDKTKKLCVIKDMSSFNNLTVGDVQQADIIIVNFTVLSSSRYFARLARLAGVNTGSLPSGGKTGGRHFDAVYNECTSGLEKRVASMKDGCSVFDEIVNDAYEHAMKERDATEGVRLDGKKAVYKNVSEVATKEEAEVSEYIKLSTDKLSSSKNSDIGKLRKDGVHNQIVKAERDPWGLSSPKVGKDMSKMKCPPLEMFFWNRVVVDEFHYLADKADRGRVLTLVLALKSSFRWCLSGTPPHANFNDTLILAKLLGIHLGIDAPLPGEKVTKRKETEKTEMEEFESLLEVRSVQWHKRRHRVGQEFLNRFVRQNIAEIDEIKCSEHLKMMNLPPAERAIYLELETHLKSLDMNSKRAMKSKKCTRGDREIRMQKVLEESGDAEEALLKRCAHFDMSSDSSNALQTCERIIKLRLQEKKNCVEDLKNNLLSALRQRTRILNIDPKWEGTRQTEKGEVQDRLTLYTDDVMKNQSVSGGADEDVHKEIVRILDEARDMAKKQPRVHDPRYAEVNGDDDIPEHDDCDEIGTKGSKKRKKCAVKKIRRDTRTPDETLYAMKYALREHVHEIRSLGKELCGRFRSLRYFKWVRDFQLKSTSVCCPSCNKSGEEVGREQAGVLSCCGHVGCLKCLRYHAKREECIDPSCQAPVKHSNVVSAVDLGADRDHVNGGNFGAKLTEIVSNIKRLVGNGDRVIIFIQFHDLKQKVAEALNQRGVKALQVKGPVSAQIKALDVLQKEVPGPHDPRVLLLTMDDESSAGVNLTTCNHAVFVHPLLAGTQQQYDAYETQAIGRIRRYGQEKEVNIWRYLARDTIDTEIFKERTGRDVN